MRNGLFASLATLLLAGGSAWGQVAGLPLSQLDAPPPAGNAFDECGPACDTFCDKGFRASVDFLRWRIANGPLPIPLVTTGNPADVPPGALGQPSTQILFGGQDIDFDTMSGGRVRVAQWFGDGLCWGAEVSGFLLEEDEQRFAVASDGAGNPPFYIPVFRSELGIEGSFIISDPMAVLTGTLAINAVSRLGGAEANGLYRSEVSDNVTWQTMVGFRYLDLDESINFQGLLTAPLLGVTNNFQESFSTKNQFYGIQVGKGIHCDYSHFYVELHGRVAVGFTREQVRARGVITQGGPGAILQGTFPGAILTQPTNLGSQSRNVFGIVPHGSIQFGWNALDCLNVSVGYDVLYWNQVVRPGNQINRNINRTQQAGGVLVGPPQPLPLFNDSDFWVQGANARVEFRY